MSDPSPFPAELQGAETLRLQEELAAIRRRCAALPKADNRPPGEIPAYDEHGLPT